MLQDVKSGRADEKSVSTLIEFARLGNPIAQLVLGSIYLEGKLVPMDRVRGVAWLLRAAGGVPARQDPYSRRAQTMILASERFMSGPELMDADRLADQFARESVTGNPAQADPAVMVFTSEPAAKHDGVVVFEAEEVILHPPEVSSDDPLYRVGLAAAGRGDCPDTATRCPGSACTGRILKPDVAPTSFGNRLEIKSPGYHGATGSTVLLLHLDRTGKVCGVALSKSSGVSIIDRAAADAAAQWKLQPARKGSEPIESLMPIMVTVR